MNGSYRVAIGSSRTPLIACDNPSAAIRMNRFISAIPSSICCPFGEKSQLKVDGIFSCRNRSAFSALANRPRRLTQAPRLVETVTSGDAVTMREASSVSPRASSLSTRPKPCCVDICGDGLNESCCGTSIAGAVRRRRPSRLNGAAARKASRTAGGSASPSNLSHSWPGRMFWVLRHFSIWATVINPAWLSLWPWNGSPTPLMV